MAARRGSKVISYEVTGHSSAPYVVSPRGPDDDVHHGAFKIPENGFVSAMISVATLLNFNAQNGGFWVQPQARFLVWTGLGFNVISAIDMGEPVQVSPGVDEWSDITRQTAAAEGATHWYFDIALFENDPREDPETPPYIGNTLALDGAYVAENGMDLSLEQYLDGDQPGGVWEGTPHNSTSVWQVDLDRLTGDGGDTGGNVDGDPTGGDPDTDPGSGPGGDDTWDDPNYDDGSTDPGDYPDTPVDTPPDVPPPVPPKPSDGGGPPLSEQPQEIPDVLEPLDPQTIAERIAGQRGIGQLQLDGGIELGGFSFNRIDEQGVLWIVEDVENWWTIAEPDIPDYPRGLDDGSYETRGRYNARIFTLTGFFIPPTRTLVRDARDRLIRASSLCHYGQWFATHEADATRASKVYLSGQPSINTTQLNGKTAFAIGLKAPDPIKYGLKDRTLPGWYSITVNSKSLSIELGRSYASGRSYPWGYPTDDETGEVLQDEAVALNPGNIRVFPVLTITGPTSGPLTIINQTTQQRMYVVKQLYRDEELVIDCMTKTVTLSGAVNQRFYLAISTDWIYIDPGSNKFFFQDDGQASKGKLTVQWRPGWIG